MFNVTAHFRKLALVSIVYLFLLSSHLQGTPGSSPDKQLSALNNQIESALNSSQSLVEGGEYTEAKQMTLAALKGLDILIEAFMPLDKRIEKLLDLQTDIERHTKQKTEANNGTSENLNALIQSQTVNREKTEQTSKLVSKMQSDGAKSSSDNQDSQKTVKAKETLKEVENLLIQSAEFQTDTIDHLEENQFLAALTKEGEAIDRLEKALKLLKKGSESQNPAQNQGQNKQKQQPSKSSKDSQSNKEKQSDKSKNKSDTQKKSMSARDALKELARMRKQSADELKRRKDKYGVVTMPNQIPVEKDW